MTEYHELFRAGIWHELIKADGTSNKFWSIKVVKNTHIRRWGPVGTEGKELTTEFDTPEEARKDAESLYLSKTMSGYEVAKPTLTYEAKFCYFVEQEQFEAFISKVYSKEYFFEPEDPDSNHIFICDGRLGWYDKQVIEDFIKNDIREFGLTYALIEDCIRQKLIPAGVYIIQT